VFDPVCTAARAGVNAAGFARADHCGHKESKMENREVRAMAVKVDVKTDPFARIAAALERIAAALERPRADVYLVGKKSD
jgi:hypothetical protein